MRFFAFVYVLCFCSAAFAQPTADELKSANDKLQSAIELVAEAQDSLGVESESPLLAGPFRDAWSRTKERRFLRKMFEVIDCPDCKLSKDEKKKAKFAILFSPKARQEFKEYIADAYETAPNKIKVGATGSRGPPVEFDRIDWENFNWEEAKEFWVEIIKTVVEVIKLFVVHERSRIQQLASKRIGRRKIWV